VTLIFVLLYIFTDTELALDAWKKKMKIEDLEFLTFGNPNVPEPLRIKTLHPLLSNLKTWAQTFGFKYNVDKHELPELKTLSKEQLENIWYNSTFTVPPFDALNKVLNI
jgi:hypothetical protein